MDWSSVAPPGSRPRYIGLPQAHTDEGGTAAAENALVTVRGGSAAAENGVAAVEEGSAGAKNGLAAVREGFAAAEIGSSRMQSGRCRAGGAHLAHAEWPFSPRERVLRTCKVAIAAAARGILRVQKVLFRGVRAFLARAETARTLRRSLPGRLRARFLPPRRGIPHPRRRAEPQALNTFITSSPRWFMTLTAMRPSLAELGGVRLGQCWRSRAVSGVTCHWAGLGRLRHCSMLSRTRPPRGAMQA